MLRVSVNTISSWENGYYEPDTENIKNIAKAFKVSLAYLMGETNNPALPQSDFSRSLMLYDKNHVEIAPDVVMIPLVTGIEIEEQRGDSFSHKITWIVEKNIPIQTNAIEEGTSQDHEGERELKAYAMEENSMAPRINKGDVVLFDHALKVRNGDLAAVFYCDRLLVRGIEISQDQNVTLQPINAMYKEKNLSASNVIVLGKALWIIPQVRSAGRLW